MKKILLIALLFVIVFTIICFRLSLRAGLEYYVNKQAAIDLKAYETGTTAAKVLVTGHHLYPSCHVFRNREDLITKVLASMKAHGLRPEEFDYQFGASVDMGSVVYTAQWRQVQDIPEASVSCPDHQACYFIYYTDQGAHQ